MPRLLQRDIKESMIFKLKEGISINKISKELTLAKSTIYHHYKKLNGKRFIEPNFESNLSKEEGELLGVIIGDGSISYYKKYGKYSITIYFGNINIKYAKYVKKRFEKFINKKLKIYRGNERSIRIKIDSKKLYTHFNQFLKFEQKIKHSTVEIINLNELPLEFRLGILKGLIDTDGCVSKEKKTGRLKVQFFTTSKKLGVQFELMIKNLGFECGKCTVDRGIMYILGRKCMTKPYYSIFLYKKDVIPFINLVRPYKAKKYGLVD